jgi:hypothetical protein
MLISNDFRSDRMAGHWGKVLKIEKGHAEILVKRVLPCGDACRKCSAGCYIESDVIKAKISEDMKAGDLLEILVEKGKGSISEIQRYGISFAAMLLSVVIAFIAAPSEYKTQASGAALFAGIILSHFAVKEAEKIAVRRGSVKHTIIGSLPEGSVRKYMR